VYLAVCIWLCLSGCVYLSIWLCLSVYLAVSIWLCGGDSVLIAKQETKGPRSAVLLGYVSCVTKSIGVYVTVCDSM